MGNNYIKGNGKDFHNSSKPSNHEKPNNEQPDIIPFLKEITNDNLAELINKNADNVAKCIQKGANSYTQIRKFYDELLSLQKKAANDKDFKTIQPMIYLVKSKAAYARGKNNINDNLEKFFMFYIDKITNEVSLKHFMLYFEAVLGYLRRYTK